MKRKAAALVLAVTLCLTLLSACKANDTPKDEPISSSQSVSTPAEQPPKEEQPPQEPPQEEPKEDEPEESAEPTQEPKEEENAGTKLLALLQEEYQNGFAVEGERPGCTYYTSPDLGICESFAFISNGIVYIWDYDDDVKIYSYDIAAKKSSENKCECISERGYLRRPIFVMNDDVYYDITMTEIGAFDYNGVVTKTATGGCVGHFDKGILTFDSNSGAMCLYSYELEKIAEIPATVQREAEHGTTKNVQLNIADIHAAGGTLYVLPNGVYHKECYRLNTDTYEWEESEFIPDQLSGAANFCGKYVARQDGIYDRLTEEPVFECGELYPPACVGNRDGFNLCYFGGDKYLGSDGHEYRWVNLTDLSMSDPLPFPERKTVTILNDTYCVYKDGYGWFLWNYNTGEEEAIYMFEK